MPVLVAASLGANLAFAVFLAIAAFGFIFGFFTSRGSGINNHPWERHTDAPGSRLPDEFHQFADRQVHDSDLRRAERDRRVEVRVAASQAAGMPARRHLHMPHVPALRHEEPGAYVPAAADDMTIDDINRQLADEAAARAMEQDATRGAVSRVPGDPADR